MDRHNCRPGRGRPLIGRRKPKRRLRRRTPKGKPWPRLSPIWRDAAKRDSLWSAAAQTPLWLGRRGPRRSAISRNWGIKNDAAFPLSLGGGRGILVSMTTSRVKAPPSFLERLKTALISALAANDISAKVRTERVPTTKLYRLAVLAPKFKTLKHSERQNLVWRIADSALSPDEQLHISMILTLTPDEVEER